MFAKKIVAGILAVAMVFSLTACGVNITTLTLPETLEVKVGKVETLTPEYAAGDNSDADALAEAAAKLTLTWASSDEAVATVDAEGKVTALAAGETDVTVATEDGKLTATCRVVVLDPTASDDDDTDTTKLALDSEGADALEAIKATGVEVPEEIVADQLTWTSSDESVATVDATGHVTPVGVGTCVITATGKLADGQDWTAQCCFSIQETVDEEPAAETTDKDSSDSKDTSKTDSKTTGKTDGKTDSNKNGSTATGGENVSGGNNNSGSSATGNENASGGNNTPAPTPAPAPDPTPAPDTGNNGGNAVTDGGHGNDIIPGAPEKNPDGTWEGDGGNAEIGGRPDPAPVPDPVPPADNGGNAVTNGGHGNDIIQGAPEQNPDGTWEGDGGNAEIGGRPDPAPVE